MAQRQFKDVRMVTCQGTVIALARQTTQTTCDTLWYNILDLDTASSNDALDWSGFVELAFPTALRPAGMALVDADVTMMTGVGTADAPFAAFGDATYVHIFRQSNAGTLWYNRFRLQREATDGEGEAPLVLNPAWEVRFRNSGRFAYADGTRDPQSSLDADGEPFPEPIYDLTFVTGVESGRFAVTATESPAIGGRIWHIFTTTATSAVVKHYAVPSTDAAPFDLSATPLQADYSIAPTDTITLQDKDGNALAATAGPAALLYARRERRTGSDGQTMLKRELRVMLAQPVDKAESPAGTALVDFGVATQGTLAQPPATLPLTDLNQANYSLTFRAGNLVSLPNVGGSLNVTGSFGIDLWVRPMADQPARVQVIGDDQSANARGPYLDLVEGGRVAVGFGTGSAVVEASTDGLVVPANNWTHLVATFTADGGGGSFSLTVNGDSTPLSNATATAKPNGPITRMGRASGGFLGQLDQVSISIDGAVAGTWPLDDVDYTADPPTTPDTHTGAANPGTVEGATLVAAATPLQTDSGGSIVVDDDGLTVESGLAAFVKTTQTQGLLAGSDGLVHLYQCGTDGAFTVAQFSTATARATFQSFWQAVASGDGGTEETGPVSYVSRRAGTMMNGATITIGPASDSGDASLCDITIETTEGKTTETWKGVPRRLDAFVPTVSGRAVAQPSDPGLGGGGAIFFDYDGVYSQARVPVGDASWAASVVMIGLMASDCPLIQVAITAETGSVALTLTYQPALWASGTAVPFLQRWTGVPATSQKMVQVLAGTLETYDYAPTDGYGTSGEQHIWTLTPPGQGRGSPSMLFLGKEGVVDVTLKVEDGSTVDLAKVTWGATISSTGKSAVFDDAPRALAPLAAVLNGTATGYDYGSLASGDRSDLNANLMVLSNSPSATAVNRNADPLPLGNMLAGASLLRAYQSGGEQRDLVVTAPITKTAGFFQSAVVQGATLRDTPSNPLRLGSTLLGVSASRPSNGAVALVQDTTALTDGTANLVVQGTNGGWMRVPPPFALDLAGATTVTWDMNAPLAPSLAPSGNLSIEGWLRQPLTNAPIVGTKDRVLTYVRSGTPAFPDRTFRWMIGTEASATLKLTPTTRIFQGVDMPTKSGSMEWRIGVLGGYTGFIGSLNDLGTGTTVFKVRLKSDNTVSVLNGSGTEVIGWSTALAPGLWHYVGVTFAVDDTTMTVKLSVDGGTPVSGSITGLAPDIRLGQGFFGDPSQGQNAALINEGSLWRRALSDAEVMESAARPLPDTSPDLGARYVFTEGSGRTVANIASSGPTLDVTISVDGDPVWQSNGLYRRPMVAVADRAMAAISSALLGWTHFALRYTIGNALRTQLEWWADAGTSSVLSPGAELSLEAWVAPDAGNANPNPQGLIARQGSYTLQREANGTITFVVTTNQGDFSVTTDLTDAGTVAAGAVRHVAATAYTGTVQPTSGYQDELFIKYQITLKVYIDGALAKTFDKADLSDTVTLTSTSNPFYMGRNAKGDLTFTGALSQVRVWQTVLTPGQVQTAYQTRWVPADRNGLVSFWPFTEMTGKLAADVQKVANATLTSNEMWLYQDETGRIVLMVQGETVELTEIAVDAMGGYGTTDRFILSEPVSATVVGYSGQIDDLRLWDVVLTTEQVTDSMFRLLSGAEDHLAGYWRFDNGSGTVITDFTGRGNTGTVTGAAADVWLTDGAPVSNEAPQVLNVLGGLPNRYNRTITGTPTSVEYADVQTDSVGTLFSVMKRAYMAPVVGPEPNALLNISGFKVGDLDTVHIGQVQTRPNLIGYMEGAPPIPSENQTAPYYLAISSYFKYVGITKVALEQSQGLTYAFQANESQDYAIGVSAKIGLAFEMTAGTSAGIGAEVQVEPVKTKVKGWFGDGFTFKWGGGETAAFAIGTTRVLGDSLGPAGVWEAEDAVFNPTVGRRFVTDSVGYALVKSLTADLYSSQLKGSDTTVKLTVIPSEDIPPDVNLIDFPLNPAYVQTSSLDGKIGLKELPEQTPSFFRPVEAYALKREAERVEAEAASFYDGFDVNTYRASRFSSETGLEKFKSEAVAGDPTYDWSNDVTKRSIVNTYVWTAGGGYHSEETQLANSYAETYTGLTVSEGNINTGFEFEAPGVFGGADATFDTTVTVAAEKSRSRERGFSLTASVDADGWLNKPIVTGGSFAGFEDSAAPGKVDGYRFMAMFLPPSQQAFDTFFAQVVDPVWLAQSDSPSAAALREASVAENGSWRVLYRTTYVSRVPPSFQSSPTTEDSPDIDPPPRIASVSWLTRIVEGELVAAGHAADPTPENIGAALLEAFGTDAGAPGELGTLVPWWASFLTAAEDLQNDAAEQNYVIRTDALDWMISRWDALEAESGAIRTMAKLAARLDPAR